MDYLETKDWPSLLDTSLDIINNRKNRMTNMTPNEVTTENSNEVFAKLWPSLAANRPFNFKPRFKLHDKVRILDERPESKFTKSANARGSEDTFYISRIQFGPNVITYRLATTDTNELISGRYQEKELLRA